MYTKQDLVKFGSYLLSQDRAKRVASEYPDNMHFAALAAQVTESDFEAVWPSVKHEITQEDLDVNGPIADIDGNQLQAGDVVEVPTMPDTFVDVPSEN